MRRSKLSDNDYVKFYKAVLYGKIIDEIESSVKASYKDLCRTITGFAKNEHHDEIFNNAVEKLVFMIKEMISSSITCQESFDEWHLLCCNSLINIFKPQDFYYGQAQKWINMSLKNLSMLNHDIVKDSYEYFHIPLDNFIFAQTGRKTSVAWSRINNYQEYLDYQKWFRNKFNGIPLDEEFYLWLKASRDIE